MSAAVQIPRSVCLVVLALLWVLSACTGAGEVTREPDPEPTRHVEPPDEPPLPGDKPAEITDPERAVFDVVAREIEQRAVPRPEALDPTLCKAADLLGAWMAESGRPPGPDEVRAAVEVAGGHDTFVHLTTLHIDDVGALSEAPGPLVDFLDASADRTANAYGVGWRSAGGAAGELVLLSAFRVLALEPLSRQADSEGKVRVRGRILEKNAEVSLVLNTGDPASSGRLPLDLRNDGGFATDVTLPPGVAHLDAEFVGVGPSWGRSFATVRLHRGALPTTLEEASRQRLSAQPTSAPDAARVLLERINHRRTVLGLSALVVDPGLEALAELDAQLYALGNAPERASEGVEARLKAFGVPAREARFVLATDNNLSTLLELVWYDPTRRKRLLAPEATTLGLAVLDNPPQAGRRHTLLAYVVQAPGAIDPQADARALLTRLNDARTRDAHTPLTTNAAIARVANRHAYPVLAAGKPDPRLAEEIVEELRKSGVTFTSCLVDIQAAPEPDKIKFNKKVVQGEWTDVGVATARGPFGKGRGELLVSIIVVVTP